MSKIIESLPADFEHCISLNLRKANRVMSQIYDHYLSKCHLKGTQFSILRATYLLKKTTNKELQDILVLDQTTLSRNLKPLVRDGFIITQEGEDRRIKELALTKQGHKLFNIAEQQWALAQAEVKNKLGTKNTDLLHSLSEVIVNLKE